MAADLAMHHTGGDEPPQVVNLDMKPTYRYDPPLTDVA